MESSINPFMQKYGAQAQGMTSPRYSLSGGQAMEWGEYVLRNLVHALAPFTLTHWMLYFFCFLFTTFIWEPWYRERKVSELSFKELLSYGLYLYIPVAIIKHIYYLKR
jgi:hypothetical protein